MCLGIPGKVIEIIEDVELFRMARVSFGGTIKEVNVTFVPETQPGDYVIVHVGFALSIIEEEEANRIFEYLAEINEIEQNHTLRLNNEQKSV
jgi:hydrogenase expression/formation protein HypC